MTGVATRAIAAHVQRELDRDAERAERERIRQAEERAADEEALTRAVAHPWIAKNLPDVAWVLVDRRFPQETYVISPVDEQDIRIIVTIGQDYECRLAADQAPGQRPAWLVGADRCETLADLGRAIDDRRRPLPPSEVAAPPSDQVEGAP